MKQEMKNRAVEPDRINIVGKTVPAVQQGRTGSDGFPGGGGVTRRFTTNGRRLPIQRLDCVDGGVVGAGDFIAPGDSEAHVVVGIHLGQSKENFHLTAGSG